MNKYYIDNPDDAYRLDGEFGPVEEFLFDSHLKELYRHKKLSKNPQIDHDA